MDAQPGPGESPSGRLATNIVHFARTLRTAGLRVGPGQILRAIEAVEAAGLKKRDDFYWTLHSVFVKKREPMSPASSPVCHTNRIDRFGLTFID